MQETTAEGQKMCPMREKAEQREDESQETGNVEGGNERRKGLGVDSEKCRESGYIVWASVNLWDDIQYSCLPKNEQKGNTLCVSTLPQLSLSV